MPPCRVSILCPEFLAFPTAFMVVGSALLLLGVMLG
jgi:hypothetical protein